MADFIFVRHGESENNTLMVACNFDRYVFEQKRAANPPLTPVGRIQAERAAARLLENVYVGSPSGRASGVFPTAEDARLAPILAEGIDEIWCSYLARAIDTGSAIQQSLRKGIEERGITDADNQAPLPVPKLHVSSLLGEIGGHYKYDPSKNSFFGFPGDSNSDVQRRWPHTEFGALMPENESDGWYKEDKPETLEQAHERCKKTLVLMENYVKTHASSDLKKRKTIAVVTHGDFFRTLIRLLVESASNREQKQRYEGEKINYNAEITDTRKVGGEILKFNTKLIVDNTSLNHLSVDIDENGGFLWSSVALNDACHTKNV